MENVVSETLHNAWDYGPFAALFFIMVISIFGGSCIFFKWFLRQREKWNDAEIKFRIEENAEKKLGHSALLDKVDKVIASQADAVSELRLMNKGMAQMEVDIVEIKSTVKNHGDRIIRLEEGSKK